MRAQRPAVVFVQRSRGYAARRSLSIDAIAALVAAVRAGAPDAVVFVDNCYGELVEEREPLEAGADVIAGSLIKNVGGGLAPAGGYIAGRAGLIERIAARVFAPGIGAGARADARLRARAGARACSTRRWSSRETLRGLDFAAALFAELGFAVDPAPGEVRTDIVQAIRLGSRERLIAFARGLQRAMPVNARFAPEPGPVPGYVDPVDHVERRRSSAARRSSCRATRRCARRTKCTCRAASRAEHTALGAMLAADAVVRL